MSPRSPVSGTPVPSTPSSRTTVRTTDLPRST